MIAEAKQTFEAALDNIKPVVASISNKFKDLGPKEMEVTAVCDQTRHKKSYLNRLKK
jgi:hypothetical protein